ncbi:MAG: VOC family protein [Actinobacteria bacterium]|nr:VOC family protein [Actinomycetota bacterium]
MEPPCRGKGSVHLGAKRAAWQRAASGTSDVIWPIHHLDLVVTDLERSVAFYQELLGWTESGEILGERGERVVYVWPPDRDGAGSIGLRAAQSDPHSIPYERYSVGMHHLAFNASSRDEVDERFAWLQERGAEIETGPREYDYTPGYYAVFFYDPDGLKLELVHRPGS